MPGTVLDTGGFSGEQNKDSAFMESRETDKQIHKQGTQAMKKTKPDHEIK